MLTKSCLEFFCKREKLELFKIMFQKVNHSYLNFCKIISKSENCLSWLFSYFTPGKRRFWTSWWLLIYEQVLKNMSQNLQKYTSMTFWRGVFLLQYAEYLLFRKQRMLYCQKIMLFPIYAIYYFYHSDQNQNKPCRREATLNSL